jgi:hypothetical protein
MIAFSTVLLRMEFDCFQAEVVAALEFECTESNRPLGHQSLRLSSTADSYLITRKVFISRKA